MRKNKRALQEEIKRVEQEERQDGIEEEQYWKWINGEFGDCGY